ncbi:hypothetical protein ELI43_37020 [Rhizobium leguminosarum]|uniref:hypothetical protein n=1 Tax=Rhizobium leguminosarum TaxID=384 RepID=UPI001030D74C|nr:hypothetical protein [Rhizobium leguminosarum]TAU35324.1 hypothetical protein ELI43_37020 [Rhizobium leguminosarum]
MNIVTSSDLKLKSEELETRLRALRLGPRAKHFPELSDANCHVEDDQMNAIHRRLRRKLDRANGMSWELLKLEWRYDLALLAYSVAVYANRLDTRFNTNQPVASQSV